ncbi:High mobility group B protein 6 [Bienertia sinuspersici]
MGAKWKTIILEEKKPYKEKYQVAKEACLQIMSKEKCKIMSQFAK